MEAIYFDTLRIQSCIIKNNLTQTLRLVLVVFVCECICVCVINFIIFLHSEGGKAKCVNKETTSAVNLLPFLLGCPQTPESKNEQKLANFNLNQMNDYLVSNTLEKRWNGLYDCSGSINWYHVPFRFSGFFQWKV